MLKNISRSHNIIQNAFLLSENSLFQQFRTVFILKRRWDPLLHKKNAKPHKLRAKHYVYDLVEDTMVRKAENLEVVLTKYVEGIGDKGEIVSLKKGVAYNKLLLPGFAVYNTPENVEKYTTIETDKPAEDVHSSPFAQRTINMLERLTLSVVMNKNENWVIEPWHIRTSLRKTGYHCKDECIILPDKPITGPDLLKENKEFYVTIVINNLEKVRVKCRIHHWSTDPSDRLPYVFEHWKEPAENLFDGLNSEENK